jgi:hypothetical protein
MIALRSATAMPSLFIAIDCNQSDLQAASPLAYDFHHIVEQPRQLREKSCL